MVEGWAGIEVKRQRDGCVVELSGEFDILSVGAIGETLTAAVAGGRKTSVDLSGVTFLDTLCVRELAMLRLLHDERLLVFSRPSREARISVAACGMEDLLGFRLGDKDGCRPAAARHSRCPIRDVRRHRTTRREG